MNLKRIVAAAVGGLSATLCLAAVLVLSGIVTARAQSPAGAGPISPIISFNVLMVKFVDQAADTIWSAAVHAPHRQCEWDWVEYRATQLATTGTLLRVGGTGPLDMQWRASPRWAPYADNMTRIALDAARAANAHDTAALRKAGDALVLNCEACHREFKPEIPTQNIVTHLSHAVPLVEELPPNCRAEGKR